LRRALITGGTGFVGAHLVRFLKAQGTQIAVLASGDEFPAPDPGVQFNRVDIRKADDVCSVVREFRPTEIYHLAGVSSIPLSWRNPSLTFEVNVVGAYNLFEAGMGLAAPPRILNVSTAQVYAPSASVLTEASLVGPGNPYAASKAMSELLSVQYSKALSGGVITARSFNHSGPGQRPDFVLSSIAKQFAEMGEGQRAPKLVVGNVDVVRDFTDVRDVVRAYLALVEKGRIGEVYNICSGFGVRLADIIAKFAFISETAVTMETDPVRLRPGEVSTVVGDSTKIRRETRWSPQIPLEKTIQDLLDFWRVSVQRGGSIEGV
jgi:GDP-4-dehydro-6-deoxy-D-mannose reductase